MTSRSYDILALVRQKLLEEGQPKFLKAPQDLQGNFKKRGGTALPKTGFVAAVPLTVIGGIIGYFGGATAGLELRNG